MSYKYIPLANIDRGIVDDLFKKSKDELEKMYWEVGDSKASNREVMLNAIAGVIAKLDHEEGTENRKAFYFTFGSDPKMPYQGGWIVIYAENRVHAQSKFSDYFRESAWIRPGTLAYAFDYTAEEFRKTNMWRTGNMGQYLHNVID